MTLVTSDVFQIEIDRLRQSKMVWVDLETTGLDSHNGDVMCGVATLDDGGRGLYWPFRHAGGGNLSVSDHLPQLISSLCMPNTCYGGFNFKFDLKFLHAEKANFVLPIRIRDPMLAAHLNNENETSFALKNLTTKYLSATAADEDKKLKHQLDLWGYSKGEMWRLPSSAVAPYAIQDVILARDLERFLMPLLEKQDLEDVYEEVCLLSLAVTNMEIVGMPLDRQLCRQYQNEARVKSMQISAEISRIAGRPMNPASPVQVQKWLGIGSSKLEELERLGKDREDVSKLLLFRGWSKVDNTYYSPFLKRSTEDRPSVHCNLKIHGTDTGRLSCHGPNLQAIPQYTEVYKVKDVFKAPDGYSFVEADYSQAEVRVATHYAQEEKMRELLLAGADIHGSTAKNIGIPRDAAKRLNFSVIYGIGANTLSNNLKITEAEARKFLTKYHNHYPGFKTALNRAESIAKKTKFIRLYTGRRRHFNTAHADPHNAFSNLIQGTVNEMVREAICRLWLTISSADVVMIMTVHDSILFLINNRVLTESLVEIKRVMEDHAWCSVPPKVDFKVGPTWGSTKGVTV